MEVVQKLSSVPELGAFRLVGGTAIALHIGHRKSVDIDFFSNERTNKKEITAILRSIFPNTEFFLNQHRISFEASDIRIELFDDWSTPFLEKPIIENEIRLASLNDLAAFKLDAIIERREKKDYIDLFVIFKKLGAMHVLQQFKSYNPHVSAKSVLFALEEVHTARSNKSVMPEMLLAVSWSDIENAMIDAAREYLSVLTTNRNKN
ncbi:MAG: nucleotidyl transferase AbiEii/AbiGii toxin family protein [Cyclobacteriaceae bacterium]|nr:nucleotidyl transferase AbiEii/AbiGii toxin family protein [Cyclobacteriaceae bacterium]